MLLGDKLSVAEIKDIVNTDIACLLGRQMSIKAALEAFKKPTAVVTTYANDIFTEAEIPTLEDWLKDLEVIDGTFAE